MARPARSLDVLLGQLNALAPNRSKASDGWIGDPAHAGRVSDHNPDAAGIVHARDYTHDPAGGLDCHRLEATLRLEQDPRIKYVIWNRAIMSGAGGPEPWVRRPYTGANPHTQHLHLSVVSGAAGDNTAAWAGITPTEGPSVELTDKIKFWDGFEITVGQGIADAWQLANNLSARGTRPGKPADTTPWITQMFGELAAIRTEQARQAGVQAGHGELLRQIADDEALDLAAIRQAADEGATAALERGTVNVDISVSGTHAGD